MPDVFLLYMPQTNLVAMAHYQDTIKNKVPLSRISPFVPRSLQAKLTSIFGDAPIAVWGSEAGPKNRSKFETMSPGDDVLIVEGQSIKLIGKIAAKVESEELSRELWKARDGRGKTNWKLIYFIANPRELEVPFANFCSLFGYAPHFQLRGFTSVGANRLEQFYKEYDDLYSVLVRIQKGESPETKPMDLVVPIEAPSDLSEALDDIDGALPTRIISEHIRMQWTLARLGAKAGERVWVPTGDQTRIRKESNFESFDLEFAAGIDLPHSYVENIDVIWKQEFRIGAAYEIENSTSIYSGLLRFADLNILAPNTLYPMFVVAPREKKNRLREQVRRPTFKRLELDKKVRFLPYEAIDEIDKNYAPLSSGLTVKVMLESSEALV